MSLHLSATGGDMPKEEAKERRCHFCRRKRLTRMVDKRTPTCKECLGDLNKKYPQAKLMVWT